MKQASDAIVDARRSVLLEMSDYGHRVGREGAETAHIAQEFRRLADRMSNLYRNGTPMQIAMFFEETAGTANGKG